MLKYADVNVEMTVSFEDNGEDDLPSQALEAAEEALGVISFNFNEAITGASVLGRVRDTEFPE